MESGGTNIVSGVSCLLIHKEILFPRHPRKDAVATMPATGTVPQDECSEHPVAIGGGDIIAGETQTTGKTHQYMSCGWHWVLSSLSLFAGDFSCSMDPPPSLETNAPPCPGLRGYLAPSAHRYCEQGCQEHTADTL